MNADPSHLDFRRTPVCPAGRTRRADLKLTPEGGITRGLFAALLITLPILLFPARGAAPTDQWLRWYGLQSWQTVFDQDGDGFTEDQEFNYGTDPLKAASFPFQFVNLSNHWTLRFAATPGVRWSLDTSTDLISWTPVEDLPPPTNGLLSFVLPLNEAYRFYRTTFLTHTNSDNDCLLDFEELTLFGTNPLLTDTDGDGVNDCDEVLLYHTNPNYASPSGRGAISGKVVLDGDGDAATREGLGLAGWTVFLDSDYDGQPSAAEPSAETQADGSYLIAQIDPGLYRVRLATRPAWLQVFPASVPPLSPDGYPDRVVSFFDSGRGPMPGPYGKKADALPGARLVLGRRPEPVDLSIVLGAPTQPIAAPVGVYTTADWLTLPTNSHVTLAFDGEEIVDGPGPDFIVQSDREGGETAELYLGSTESNLTFAQVIPADPYSVDLETLQVPKPVRFVKVRSLSNGGSFPGFDLAGLEALNYRTLPQGAYDVTVVGGETVTNIDFGVIGNDRPPRVLVSLDNYDLRAGQPAQVTVTVSDDVGVSHVALRANGVAVPLDATLRGTTTPWSGGLIELFATATDTAGHATESLLPLIARNADGTLPDLSGLGVTGHATGGPAIRVASPVAGEILSEPRNIVGTISGSGSPVATWQVHYALADLVNPEALSDNDPDYVLLNQGVGPVTSASLGTLAGDTLPAGAYLLRVSATDANSTTAYLGFVVGVRVDPLDIRPEIVITRPTNETVVTFMTNILGSITTRQQLREWYVERAPLSQVNLQNLSDNTPSWTRIASGTNSVTNRVLATFDATLVPNDSYVIRVSAWNRNGLGWAEPLVLHVTGSAKLGNFAVEFTDVSLPLAGIPITVKRVYNSLNAARSGDFGYGWSLGAQDADIAETIPQTGTGFGSTPFKTGTRVYLTAPDGKRIGFTFEPKLGAYSFFGASYSAFFKPDPGITYTLEVPERDAAFLTLNSAGEALLFFLPLPWNPDTYILTDKLGTSYTYDQSDGLLEIKDANANRVTFSDTAIKHSAGPEVSLTRDSSGRLTRIVAPDGQTWSYQYDGSGDLVQMTHPGNIVATFGYAANRAHFLETINDPMRGPTQRSEYDANGRLTAIIDAAGNRIEQTWNPGAFTGTYTDGRGNVTLLTYDARGNLTRRQDPLGGVTTWAYTNVNYPDLETSITDPRGNRTSYTYDERGNLLTEIHSGVSKRTTYTYDENNRATSKAYGTGGREDYEYDTLGNLIHYSSLLGQWTLTYTSGGLVASVLDGTGGLTRFEYDGALALPARVIAPDGATKHFRYDASGRPTQATDEVGRMTRFEYDAAGRVARRIDPRGGETRTAYDSTFPQRPGAVTNRIGRVTQFAYDALGRVRQVTDATGAITRYEYDADGNRTAVVDAVSNRTEFAYDQMSRLIEETDPLGKKRQYAYDLAGNRTNSVDRLGRGRSFVHDALNLVSQERWHDATGAVMRTFTFAYDALDRVRQVNDPDAIETLTWEAVPGGKRLSERATYPGQTQRIVNYSYDGAGRLIDWQLFGILHARYTRDVAGHLRILTGEAGVTNRWRLEFWRDARGDLSELRRFIGLDGEVPVVNTFYTIDLCGCGLSSIEHRDASNQPLPGASIFFARSADGAITNLLDGTNTFAFTYDAAAQLTGATGNGIPTESYSYDANGNRLTSHLHASYTTETGNRTTSADQYALAYDDEGNLVTKSNQLTGDVFTFTWDHRNRLTQVMKANSTMPTGSFVTQYRYDGFDRRIAVIRGNQTNWTYYRAEQPIADYLNNETTPAELYFTGGEVVDDLQVVVRRGERFYWTLTDHLGSVRRVLDTNGVEVAALRYDSFGNPLGATGTRPNAAGRFGFTGRERDSDSGLQYNRARYFDPELGRFISVDPIGFESGEVNHYRYAKNDPLHLTDPSGTVAAIEFRILAGGILGCASSGITELFCDTYSLDLAKANKGDLAATCIAGAAGGALGGATGDPFVALLFTQAFALLAEKGGNAAGYDIDLGGILECAGGLLK